MGVKVGSFVMQATTPFSVVIEPDFNPQWIIFLFSNTTVEGVWMGGASGGIGMAGMLNSQVDKSGAEAFIRNCQVSEVWYNTNVGGSFLGDLITWIRNNGVGGDNWAVYTSSIDPDGFTIQQSPSAGFYQNAAGKIVYYIAGDDSWEEVALRSPFAPGGASSFELGWTPQAFFGIGAGGHLGDPPRYSASYFDLSMSSVMAGHFGDDHPAGFPGIVSEYRGILDPNVNVQSAWGYNNWNTLNPVDILEPTQAGGAWLDTAIAPGRTETAITASFWPGGFSGNEVRMDLLALGSTAAITGSFVPLLTTGVPTDVVLPFTPEAVFFFSVQDDKAGVANYSIYGATVYGFCAEDGNQAVLAYGGLWNPPTPQQSAIFISGQYSWMGNCIETGAVGTVTNIGSAEIIPGGFRYTTEQNSASIAYPVLYWAIGPTAEAPGFFRVVHR